MSSTATVAITLDGQPHEVRSGMSLAELIRELGHEPKAVATAVGGSFVARDDRAGRLLQPGDAVLLFQPIVGG